MTKWIARQSWNTAVNDPPIKAHQRNQLSILGIHDTYAQKSANHDRHIHSKNLVQMNDTVSQKWSDNEFAQGCHKLTRCKEHHDGGKPWGANHEGKVRNSRPAKSTPREVSCEGLIAREKSNTHVLWRARRGRWAVRGRLLRADFAYCVSSYS